MKEKTDCPKCGKKLEKRPNQFFLREAGLMPGLICESCNALYESREWIEALVKRTKEYKERDIKCPTCEEEMKYVHERIHKNGNATDDYYCKKCDTYKSIAAVLFNKWRNE